MKFSCFRVFVQGTSVADCNFDRYLALNFGRYLALLVVDEWYVGVIGSGVSPKIAVFDSAFSNMALRVIVAGVGAMSESLYLSDPLAVGAYRNDCRHQG